MFGIIKVTLVFLAVFAGQALAGKGCRQCSGLLTYEFLDFYTHLQIQRFIKNTFGACATGQNGFELSRATFSNGITRPEGEVYSGLEILVKASRYCGNGSKVKRTNKNQVCSEGICATKQVYDLKCSGSVHCDGDCDLAECT